jgi:dihydrofolate reductase
MSPPSAGSLSCMALVTAHFTMSLDGFMAGPDQTEEMPLGVGGAALHRWMFDEARTAADVAAAEHILASRGAYIMGRNMFGPVRGDWGDEDWRGWWGAEPPYHAPVFVLTHHEREPVRMEGGTTFHFVGTFAEAFDRAAEAANGETVTIAGGASLVRQGLEAGVVDRVMISHVPVVLGSGAAPFAGLPGFNAEITDVLTSPFATHVFYEITKS